MTKKKVLKITPVLNLLNILIILIICLFYGFRFLKYYRLEHNKKEGESSLLVDEIIKKQSYLDLTKGLVLNEETNVYTYIGEIDDNYVSYSGYLFRIISVDEKKNIKLVSEDILTYMYSGLENGYDKSFLLKWLNKSEDKHSGVFESTLYDSENLLVKTRVCSDVIDNLENITCNEINDKYNIGLLSLNDYKSVGGKGSYLNNGKSYYLSSLDSQNGNYYMLDTGDIALNFSNSKITGVRPVITISGETILVDGNGTKGNPYVIEKHEVLKLKDAYVGQYVSIGKDTFKIVNINDNKVKVAMVGVLKDENGENFSIEFSKTTNKYSDDTIVGNYLNKDYYNSIENKDIILEGEYPVGNIVLSNLDYALVNDSTSKAKIGMLTFGDLFVHEYSNIFTLSRGLEASNIINVINSEGYVFADYNYNKYNVRPAMYLDGNLSIESGIGSEHGPYQLGVVNE